MNIRELLLPELITLDLKARRREEALQELAALLASAGVVTDREAYLQAVRDREALGSTAVGFGIAIPHARSRAVRRAAVAFGRSVQGIHWEGQGGEPVRAVFLIAAPEGADDLHLRALAHLARMLMHEEVRQKLLSASGPDEVLEALG
ncbi:MAG: PTS sugar transporter subunit IIA [Bacillota bacterium]